MSRSNSMRAIRRARRRVSSARPTLGRRASTLQHSEAEGVSASLPCRDAVSARSARGVTLLELLIVIALMAIVAGFVIPMFNGPVSTSELRASARQLAAGLRLARSEALAERRETFLVVDVAGKRFKVDRDPAEHALSSRVDVKLFTAQNDLVSDTIGSIRFFPDGGSNGGRITVASGARKFDVDVDWLTGRVAILD